MRPDQDVLPRYKEYAKLAAEVAAMMGVDGPKQAEAKVYNQMCFILGSNMVGLSSDSWLRRTYPSSLSVSS